MTFYKHIRFHWKVRLTQSLIILPLVHSQIMCQYFNMCTITTLSTYDFSRHTSCDIVCENLGSPTMKN